MESYRLSVSYFLGDSFHEDALEISAETEVHARLSAVASIVHLFSEATAIDAEIAA